MKLLGIDTATEACSAALFLDGEVTGRYEFAPRDHTRLILPMVEGLLAEAGVALADLDAIAFGRGPGSFTGVRIATGVAQGIAFAADLPVVPVSTLAMLAQQAIDERGRVDVLTAIDARMGEVYWGVYRRGDDGLAELVETERVIAPAEVPQVAGETWFGIGSGWTAYADVLCQRLGAVVADWQGDTYPQATQLVKLAAAGFSHGHWVPAERAEPVYLRDRVAEKPKSLF